MMLENKVAIVTGAGQGVGQGIALALASHGAKLAVLGRTLSKLEETSRQIEERGGEARALLAKQDGRAGLGPMIRSSPRCHHGPSARRMQALQTSHLEHLECDL